MTGFLSDGVFWGYLISVVVVLLIILFVGRHTLWYHEEHEPHYENLARPGWGFCRSSLVVVIVVAAALLIAAMYQADTRASNDEAQQNLRIWFGFVLASLLVWGLLFFGSLNFLAASWMGLILFVTSIFLYFLVLMADVTAAWLFLIPFLVFFYCLMLSREIYRHNLGSKMSRNQLYWD